jgi:hypothetical protein
LSHVAGSAAAAKPRHSRIRVARKTLFIGGAVSPPPRTWFDRLVCRTPADKTRQQPCVPRSARFSVAISRLLFAEARPGRHSARVVESLRLTRNLTLPALAPSCPLSPASARARLPGLGTTQRNTVDSDIQPAVAGPPRRHLEAQRTVQRTIPISATRLE